MKILHSFKGGEHWQKMRSGCNLDDHNVTLWVAYFDSFIIFREMKQSSTIIGCKCRSAVWAPELLEILRYRKLLHSHFHESLQEGTLTKMLCQILNSKVQNYKAYNSYSWSSICSGSKASIGRRIEVRG